MSDGEPIPGKAPSETVKPAAKKGGSTAFNIQETTEGFKVTMPAGFTDIGAIGTYSKLVKSREEAEHILQRAGENLKPGIEIASLEKSFTSFHSIQPSEDGKYTVTFPALRSLDNPRLLAGTSQKSFDTWEDARNYYLETRSQREYPEDAIFQLNIDGVDYRFSHLNKFGKRPRLSDKPLEVSEQTKKVLEFDTRNTPDTESALTYYKTLEVPGWQYQVFRFVEDYSTTPEGQEMFGSLGIKDLRLLTPQQAARLSLEVVTRLKKYNLDEMDLPHGETESDQNSALFLIHRGLRERDSSDFRGNGICRNFASAVKVVFDGIKSNQTPFNYLRDTYAFYESGPRSDFDPSYVAPPLNVGLSMKQDQRPGHAWNSFITIDEGGVSQTVADATWSYFDYDTQESIKLDYTLQRMEKDVYRNLQRKDARVDIDQAAQFYLFLVDSLPQQEGLVLDTEAKSRLKSSEQFRKLNLELKSKYEGLSPDEVDNFTLEIYKKIADAKNLQSKTQFYLGRAMEVVRGREQGVSGDTATELTRIIAEKKEDVGYFDVVSIYDMPTQRPEDRSVAVKKYVKAWETAGKKGYTPVRDLIFGNKEIQEAVLHACSEETKMQLLKELLFK